MEVGTFCCNHVSSRVATSMEGGTDIISEEERFLADILFLSCLLVLTNQKWTAHDVLYRK